MAQPAAEHRPVHGVAAGSVPGLGTSLGRSVSPWSHTRKATSLSQEGKEVWRAKVCPPTGISAGWKLARRTSLQK